MPFMMMQHSNDPKQELREKLGDLSTIELFNNQILVAIYIRPEKTKSGLYLPDTHRDEDRVQSKVGLVVKMGPSAFVEDGSVWFDGVTVNEDDWVFFRPSDGWGIVINNVQCRILDDVNVRGRVDQPDRVW